LLLPAVFHDPLQQLIAFAYESNLFFYILLIPFVSLYFFYVRKGKIFSNVTYCFPAGGLIVLAGFILYFVEKRWGPLLGPTDSLAVMTASLLLTWVGGFIFFYGLEAFKKSAFPLCFLFLMIPIPSGLLEQVIVLLQKGSTETVDWIFKITGVPAQRNGFVFSLSNIEFEVAKQCSGIRSGLYLFLTSLVFGQLFLKTSSRRAFLTFSVLPIAIFKNGLRIVTITLLGNYVHESILTSNLHRQGGIPFMIVAVIFLALVIKWLRKTEQNALTQKISKTCGQYLVKGGGTGN